MRLFSLFLVAGVLSAQSFTFGVKGGVRLTDDLEPGAAVSESKRYVVGPMATAKLPLGFRLEFDALYRHVGDRTAFGTIHFFVSERERGNSWEFPMVVRRMLWHGVYAGGGYAPRVINGGGHAISSSVFPVSYSESDVTASWQTTHGVIAEAGVERRAGPLRIAPEVRYTYWNQPASPTFGSTQHQVDLLVGITF